MILLNFVGNRRWAGQGKGTMSIYTCVGHLCAFYVSIKLQCKQGFIILAFNVCRNQAQLEYTRINLYADSEDTDTAEWPAI